MVCATKCMFCHLEWCQNGHSIKQLWLAKAHNNKTNIDAITHTHTYIYIYMCVCVYVYINIYDIYIYIYICIQTMIRYVNMLSTALFASNGNWNWPGTPGLQLIHFPVLLLAKAAVDVATFTPLADSACPHMSTKVRPQLSWLQLQPACMVFTQAITPHEKSWKIHEDTWNPRHKAL